MTEQSQGESPSAQTVTVPDKSFFDKVLDQAVVYKPFMSDVEVTMSARTVLKFFVKPTKSGKVCSIEQAVHFTKLCQARGLNPWEGDAYLVGYDTTDGPEFNIITAHQALLKRAEVHPNYDGMESGVTIADADGSLTDVPGTLYRDGSKLAGAWAKVYFKNRSHPTYRRLRFSTYNQGRSRWGKDPAGMIVKCAEAAALRQALPSKMGGLYLREEFDLSERPAVQQPQATGNPPANDPVGDDYLPADTSHVGEAIDGDDQAADNTAE